MKTLTIFTLACLGSLCLGQDAARENLPLESGFRNPPAQARPLAWWHWMNGNITKEGIQADLEAMAQAGLAGAQWFTEATFNVPKGPVSYHSDAWYDHARFACQTAEKLGLTLDVMNCAGWSMAGGPWVTPDQSMKSFVWSEHGVQGPAHFRGRLPQPPALLDYYRDAALVAVPDDEPADEPFSLTTTAAGANAGVLTDADPTTGIPLPDAPGELSMTLSFSQPIERRLLELTYDRTDKGKLPFSGTIEASDDGTRFRTLRTFQMNGFSSDTRYALSIPFEPTRARAFRVILQGLPRRAVPLRLVELRLSRARRLENFEGKTIRGCVKVSLPDFSAAAQSPNGLPLGAVLDLTGKLAADGLLEWDVPPGRWTLLRCGYTTNGRRNNPASPEGQGLEVDKMDSAAVEAHFENSLGRLLRELQPQAGRTLTGVLCDSWECGRQTWAARFPQAFKQYRGYDLGPWLPVLTGRVVGSVSDSEAFLADYRRAITELIADNFFGTLRGLCHAHGLRLCAEPYGSDSPLNHQRAAAEVDLPMGEFWVQEWKNGMPRNKELSSLAHVLGRPVFGSESFTASPTMQSEGWQQTPATLKRVGDLAFVQGVNRMMLHSYVHQPRSDLAPGFTLGSAGTHFGRLDTWWSKAGAWVDYLSRCQYLLQQGQYAADLLLLGHDEPDEFVNDTHVRVPPGYLHDTISPALFLRTVATNERFGVPGGAAYRAAVLPDSWVADLSVLQHLAALERAGVPVSGPPPLAPAGLRDLREHLAEWQALVARLWPDEKQSGSARTAQQFQQFLAEAKIEPDLRILGVQPEDTVRWVHRATANTHIYFLSNQGDNPVRLTADFRLANRLPELWDPLSGRILPAPIYRSTGSRTALDLWLPPVGSMFVVFRNPAPPQFVNSVASRGATNAFLGQDIAPAEAGLECFVAGKYRLGFNRGKTAEVEVEPLPAPIALPAPWRVEFKPPTGQPFARDFARLDSWAQSTDEAVRYFSGPAHYRSTFTLPAALPPGIKCRLDLGQVCDLAEVRVNGQSAGIVWTPPFAVDVTRLVKPGANDLEVLVINAWANRLIGDEHRPQDVAWTRGSIGQLERFPDWFSHPGNAPQRTRVTFTTSRLYNADSPLRPAGLLGPVAVRFSRLLSLEGKQKKVN